MAAPDYLSAATLTPSVFLAQNMPTSDTAQYTVASAHGLKLVSGSICNTTGASINVTISVVPNGQTSGTANRVLAAFPLGAGDTQSLHDYLGGAQLGPGDFISGFASATGVALVLTGVISA